MVILVLFSPVSSPRRFRAKVLSPSQLQVSWKEPKGEFDGYSVIYAAAPGKSTSFLLSLVGGDVCPEELKNGSEDVIESGWRAGWRWLGSEAAGVLSSSLELLSQTCLHTCSSSNPEPGSSSAAAALTKMASCSSQNITSGWRSRTWMLALR